ncbi:MAG: YggS family pyridoxal phosphate-dependent enzyme [Ornithinimicrobium sp.]
MSTPGSARAEDLTRRLAETWDRIEEAARAHRRNAQNITLIVVTKFFPAQDVAALVADGVTSIGESRDQEASAKVAELRALIAPESMPRVHMIGQVQTKKARSVVRYADAVHSVDREKLAHQLARATQRAIAEGERSEPLDVTIQVDLGSDPGSGRGGVDASGVSALADVIATSSALRLCGLMAIAPEATRRDPREAFERLAGHHQQLLAAHPQATWLSAGMSGDLEEAIAVGATHLRVGSAILGSRPAAR